MEKPILFSTPAVQAILAGQKTQTRRVVTVPWHKGKKVPPYEPWYVESDGKLLYMDECGEYHPMEDVCPYGEPGDILWVRETWASHCDECEHNQGEGHKDATCIFGDCERYAYKADDDGCPGGKWRPSIHMPREAARLFLRVTGVRVERLQDISYDDCLREGMWNYGTEVDTLAMFQELWQTLNAKRGFGWETNCWVWVISFEVVS
jgi:hypothetical protein